MTSNIVDKLDFTGDVKSATIDPSSPEGKRKLKDLEDSKVTHSQ